MKKDLNARLAALRDSGELQTGRQLAENLQNRREDDLFPGEGREEKTAFGSCYMREVKFPLHHRHGLSTLAGILSCCGPELALPARDSSLERFNLQRSVFLDVETTGLSGGTGTWAFLIGVGWLEQENFLLRQYFLRRPAEERAILSHFASTASSFSAMVTFNGKLFDLPLIQTRQMLAGFEHTVPAVHLDLLQCARILWKQRLPSRSLRALEESLLGFQRHDDIPGMEIPAVYFEYLRRGETGRMKQVFQHNVLDILSMVTLLERVSRLAAGHLIEHPAEAMALGRLCLQAGRTAEGIGHLHAAAASGLEPLALEAALELSFHYKRKGRWEDAVAIWQEATAREKASPTACVELAKYYEHRCGDWKSALILTQQAITLTASRPDMPAYSELGPPALQKRLLRLKRKLARSI